MLTTKSILTTLRQEFPYFETKYGVKKLGLFGSYAKETYHSHSDVDIVVEFKKPIGLQFVELADDIEQLLHKKIDLLTLDSLKSIRAKSVAKSIEENIIYV